MFWGNKDVPLLTVPNELSEVVLHTVRPHPLLRYQVRLRLSMYAHSIYYLIAPPLWGHGLCHWSDPCTTPTLSGVQRGDFSWGEDRENSNTTFQNNFFF